MKHDKKQKLEKIEDALRREHKSKYDTIFTKDFRDAVKHTDEMREIMARKGISFKKDDEE